MRLLTYNLEYGNANVAATLDAIVQADADVALLQEVDAAWRDALETCFADRYEFRSYRLHHRRAGGLATLSRLPIERDDLWHPPPGTGAWFPAARTLVASPFGTLQLLNVHLRPAIEDGSWFRGFMTTPPIRRAEIDAHWQQLDETLPTIVAGDFNEDPTGLAVDYLERRGMKRVATTGPRTWRYAAVIRNTTWDVIKMDIDHVMLDARLVATDGRVLDAGTSDHRPVVATIARVL